MFLALDYYVTESSGHNSEYNPWFRKRQDLIEKFCLPGTGWNPGEYAYIVKSYEHREAHWKEDILKWLGEPFKLDRGHEYAAFIFNAIFGDGSLFKFNGSVRNFGLIDNLPAGACVKSPRFRLAPWAGVMRVDYAATATGAAFGYFLSDQELVVAGYFAGDKNMIYQTVCYDPLTAAVLGLREIRAMVDEMFRFNRDYLPMFK